jgi:hypothetical protein
MERQEIPSSRDGSRGSPDNHGHSSEERAELMARTVAHLAAQLTMTQIRLRALATELNANEVVDEEAVRSRVGQIASSETGIYLRENLGEALADMIDVESLESEISSFLQS